MTNLEQKIALALGASQLENAKLTDMLETADRQIVSAYEKLGRLFVKGVIKSEDVSEDEAFITWFNKNSEKFQT